MQRVWAHKDHAVFTSRTLCRIERATAKWERFCVAATVLHTLYEICILDSRRQWNCVINRIEITQRETWLNALASGLIRDVGVQILYDYARIRPDEVFLDIMLQIQFSVQCWIILLIKRIKLESDVKFLPLNLSYLPFCNMSISGYLGPYETRFYFLAPEGLTCYIFIVSSSFLVSNKLFRALGHLD